MTVDADASLAAPVAGMRVLVCSGAIAWRSVLVPVKGVLAAAKWLSGPSSGNPRVESKALIGPKSALGATAARLPMRFGPTAGDEPACAFPVGRG